MKNPVASPIAGTIVVVAAYMGVRSIIYFLLPATSMEAWFARDTIMSVPRLAAFAALLLFNRTWKSSTFDWQPEDFGKVLLFGGLLVAFYAFYYSASGGSTIPKFAAAWLALTTVPVVLFEEYAFRGPLLTRLCQQLNPPMGILLTSLLFTVFHLQAQPFSDWGEIFFVGFILANLRIKGLSLGGLALIHFLVDMVWVFFGISHPGMTSFNGMAFQIALLLCALLSFPYVKRRNAVLKAVVNKTTGQGLK